MRVEEPEIQEVEPQEEVAEPAEVTEAEAETTVSEPDIIAMSSAPAGPECQKCHWQNPQNETHMEVVEAEVPPAEQGADLFAEYCATCHGDEGQTAVFPPEVEAMQALAEDPEAEIDEEELEQLMAETQVILNDPDFLGSRDDAALMRAIIGLDPEANLHTFAAIYGGPLELADVVVLATYIRTWDPVGPPQLSPVGTPSQGQTASGPPSFAQDIFPILEESCAGNCHLDRQRGDWSMETYESVMNSGENAPVIIPGDPDNSLLAQKLQNIQETGKQMPLKELLPQDQIDLILEWIRAGALDN